MKKILLRLCLITSIFTICMFGHTAANATSTTTTQQQLTFDKATVKSSVETVFKQWAGISYSFLNDKDQSAIYKDNLGSETYARYVKWNKIVKEAGKFDKIISTDVVMKKETAVATVRAKYSKKNITFVMKFNKSMKYTMPQVAIDNKDNSSKASVGKALLNTLMGMGTVFIVLIFISFLISLFKYIPSLLNRSEKTVEPAKEEAPVAPVVEEEEELADDGELVAVITAAIMASMGEEAPADGLVVRSIRKVNKSKWKNA